MTDRTAETRQTAHDWLDLLAGRAENTAQFLPATMRTDHVQEIKALVEQAKFEIDEAAGHSEGQP